MLLLIVTMVMPASTWAQEMYTVFNTETSTLTFKYENSKPESTDTEKVYGFPTTYSAPDWITNHASAIKKVVFDASFADARPTSCYQWFSGCKNLAEIQNIKNLNTTNVTDMKKMFYGCSSLYPLDLENFNTAEVTDMSYMFNKCSGLDILDLSSFNTAKVKYMNNMFDNCTSLTDLKISNFNTAEVNSMAAMFNNCLSLKSIDLKNFNTAKVTSMTYMFASCRKLESLDLSSFNTEKVMNMINMFLDCRKLTSLDLSNFKTYNVTTMDGMFYGCLALKELKLSSNFTTANVSGSLNEVFRTCMSLESLDLSGFYTANVTSMKEMFAYCSKLTKLKLSPNFTTANVTNMMSMFESCSSLESIDLSNFNTAKVTSMFDMFCGCSSLKSLDLSSFNTAKVTSMFCMFKGCSSLTSLDLSNFNTESVTNMCCMFESCSSLTSLDLSNFNTTNVKDMSDMFESCSSLKSLDLSNFNTTNVTDMSDMFLGCSKLTSLNLSSFNTDKVTAMDYMFDGCPSLISLNLSSFNTDKVTNMRYMFRDCSQLTTIYVSDNFTTGSVTNYYNMFSGCSKLVGAVGYDSGIIDKTRANYTTGYFSYGINTVDDWKTFANKVNDTNYTKICAGLLKDITLTNADVLPAIGSNGFTGTFNGLGHTISGLNFNSTYSALFAQNGGTIKNLGILDATTDEGATGSICQTNSGTIESCFFMGTTTGSAQSAGSICQTDNGTITNCCYLASNDDGNGGKTIEQFNSGEVCYLLSKGKDDSVWGQQLDTDNYPVLSDYKVIKAAKGDKDENGNDTYWATFSNLNSDATLSVPSARNLDVYNATVRSGKMTLKKRVDNQVAKGEGVLLKTDGEYVNAKANETNELTGETYANNNLMATPATEEIIIADAGHKLYRLTYNNVSTKTGLGFYLGVVGESKDGSQLKATPGKAYLKVSTDAATDPLTSKLALGFAFPDNDDETVTGISGVTVSDRIQTSDHIYDLQGRPVVNSVKGVYIKNGRKVVYK